MHECVGGRVSMLREKTVKRVWSPLLVKISSMNSFCSKNWYFTHTEAKNSHILKSRLSPSFLFHCVPAVWERSSRQAFPFGRRSDGASAFHFHWTWSPGLRQGGAGSAAALCLRSETGWTSSPLQEEMMEEMAKEFFLIKTFDHISFLNISTVQNT